MSVLIVMVGACLLDLSKLACVLLHIMPPGGAGIAKTVGTLSLRAGNTCESLSLCSV